MQRTRIGIVGYGNLGRGTEEAVRRQEDMELVAVFTRRDPEHVKTASGVPVVRVDEADAWRDRSDVMNLCGGSATDVPERGATIAAKYHPLHSFDPPARIPE